MRISVAPYYLPDLLWSRSLHLRYVTPLNWVVGQSSHIWSQYEEKYNLLPRYPRLASYLWELTFPLAYTANCEFLRWIEKGLVALESFTKQSSFSYLQQNYALPRFKVYKYLQIRHLYSSISFLEEGEGDSPLEGLCRDGSRDRGTISILYWYLNEYATLLYWVGRKR